MKLSIFSRLALGYLSVFAIIGAMSLYAFMRLDRANAEAGHAIIRDERLLDQKKTLADLILMQMGFDKKLVITGDQTFRDRLDIARQDFAALLSEVAAGSGNFPEQKRRVAHVADLFDSYQALLAEQAGDKPGAGRDHRKTAQDRQKEALVDGILEDLKVLETVTQVDIGRNLLRMTEAGTSARKLNTGIWAVAFFLMVGTAFFTTRGVTKPMSALVTKTKEVAKGIFKGDLMIDSPPEVALLARSFNAMCERLGAVEKMKSSFFSAMSHELRTPLTSIKEGIGLLRDGAAGPPTTKQERLLEILSEETTRMIGLVNSLLDLTKMQQGMMPYYFTKELLPLLVQRVMTEMAPLAEAKRIEIGTDFDSDIPALSVDRDRMLQALRNLTGNALKFTPDGGKVVIALRRSSRGIEVSVQDTGPGIPAENLGTIFEEFWQLPGRSPDGVQGSGLGLAIVKEIISAHGGKVWAESVPGSGTTLTFALPS